MMNDQNASRRTKSINKLWESFWVATIVLNPLISPLPRWVLRAVPPARHAVSDWAYRSDDGFSDSNIRTDPSRSLWIGIGKDIARKMVTTAEQRRLQTEVDQVGSRISHAFGQQDEQARLILFNDNDANKPKNLTNLVKINLARATLKFISTVADADDLASRQAPLLVEADEKKDRCKQEGLGWVIPGQKSDLSPAEAAAQVESLYQASEAEAVYAECKQTQASLRVNGYRAYESQLLPANIAAYRDYATKVEQAEQAFVDTTKAATGLVAPKYRTLEEQYDDEQAARSVARAQGDRELAGTPSGQARQDIQVLGEQSRRMLSALFEEGEKARKGYWDWNLPMQKRKGASQLAAAADAATNGLLSATRTLQISLKWNDPRCTLDPADPPESVDDDPKEPADRKLGTQAAGQLSFSQKKLENANDFAGCVSGSFAEAVDRVPAVYRNPALPAERDALRAFAGSVKKISSRFHQALP